MRPIPRPTSASELRPLLGTGEVGQRRSGDAHPEQADRQQVEDLGVAERRDRARCEQRRDDEVEVGGQLDDAAPCDDPAGRAQTSRSPGTPRPTRSRSIGTHRGPPGAGQELQHRTDERPERDRAGEVELRPTERRCDAEEDDDAAFHSTGAT
jgi:hypothetical protein